MLERVSEQRGRVVMTTLAFMAGVAIGGCGEHQTPELDACGSMGLGQGPVGENQRSPQCLKLLGIPLPTTETQK